MKRIVKLFIARSTHFFAEEGNISVTHFDPSRHDADVVLLGTQEVEINIPEVDVNAIMITKLEGQIQAVRAKAESEVTQLKARIQEMLAIGQEDAQ